MRAIQLSEYVKSPSDLTVSSVPDPTASEDGEYVVRVHAAAANFFDILQISGKYQSQPPFPWIAGAEFAGVIVQTSSSTDSKFKIGDRVFGSSQGAFADLVVCAEKQLFLVPDGWDFVDAAGLYITTATSYSGLVTRAGIKKGDYVLIHAAAGGVGLAAVQIAKAFGAIVIGTAGSAAKLAVGRQFGADHMINYRDADWVSQVKALTPDSRGVDIVYDPVGLVHESSRCTAWNGRIVVIGFAGGKIEKVAMNRVLLKNISIVGLFWGAYTVYEPEVVGQVWNGIFDLIKQKKLKSIRFTDQRFRGLETVGQALNTLGGRDSWGKVVIELGDERTSSSSRI